MNQNNPVRLVGESLVFECPRCTRAFDKDSRYPYLICPKEHMYCLECVHQIFKKELTVRCPACDVVICKTEIRSLDDVNSHRKSKKVKVEKSSEQLYEINGVPPEQPKPQPMGFFKRLKLAWFPPPPPSIAQAWVDPSCHDFNKMKLEANKVIVNHLWANVFSNHVLTGVESSFTIKACRLQKFMWVGIVDRKYRKEDGPRVLLFNWIYYQNDAWCQDGIQSKEHGKGFKQGDIITVKINRGTNLVQWVVNGEIGHTADCHRRLQNKDVEWVPYVYMYSKDDCFEIL